MTRSLDVLIAGAQKAGTTSLKSYLAQHPRVITHDKPEMMYFVNVDEIHEGFRSIFPLYFPRRIPSGSVLLAKQVWVMYLHEAMQLAQEINPEMKLIVVLRNPVDRAYSAYWYARRLGLENIQIFRKALFADPARFHGDKRLERICAYLDNSDYAKHIVALQKVIPKRYLHYVLYEDLIRDPAKACKLIFDFIGVGSYPVDVSEIHNRSAMPRSTTIAKLYGTSNHFRRIARRFLSPNARYRARAKLQSMNERHFEKPVLDPDTRSLVWQEFSSQIESVQSLSGLDLSVWK